MQTMQLVLAAVMAIQRPAAPPSPPLQALQLAGQVDAVTVHVELLGREGIFTAVVEPKRRSALIGAIVLEDLDFIVDCMHQRLIPRDPRFIVSERSTLIAFAPRRRRRPTEERTDQSGESAQPRNHST